MWFTRATAQSGRGWWSWTPDHEQFADMLHSGRAELVADRGQILFAFLARVVEDTDFDQFVAFETDADFMHDGF